MGRKGGSRINVYVQRFDQNSFRFMKRLHCLANGGLEIAYGVKKWLYPVATNIKILLFFAIKAANRK